MTAFHRKQLSVTGIILCLIIVLCLEVNRSYYADYQTVLLQGIYIQENRSDLKANNWSVPLVYDWDGDGKKDLLIGNRTYEKNKRLSGYVSFYKNVGSDSEPSFTSSSRIKACTTTCSSLSVIADG